MLRDTFFFGGTFINYHFHKRVSLYHSIPTLYYLTHTLFGTAFVFHFHRTCPFCSRVSLQKCGMELFRPKLINSADQTSCGPSNYCSYGEKFKCALVQALRLCTGRTAHRGSRGIALFFLDHGTRRGWGVSVTPRPLFTLGNTRHPLSRRLGGPQSRSGQVRKISPPTGIRSPDRPARNQSLCRLRYPVHTTGKSNINDGLPNVGIGIRIHVRVKYRTRVSYTFNATQLASIH
jgi:hypothetical protein